MTSNPKADLHAYLRDAREVLVWKLDGLDEYDLRRPLTPTGTNLLGLVRHSGASHLRYFTTIFGRTDLPDCAWLYGDGTPNAEHWVPADRTRTEIIDACRTVWAHAGTIIDELDLDTIGTVAWWQPTEVTLHRVLIHVTAETQRHAGHADILREHLDGTSGLLAGHDNLHLHDPTVRAAFHRTVDDAARRATSE